MVRHMIVRSGVSLAFMSFVRSTYIGTGHWPRPPPSVIGVYVRVDRYSRNSFVGPHPENSSSSSSSSSSRSSSASVLTIRAKRNTHQQAHSSTEGAGQPNATSYQHERRCVGEVITSECLSTSIMQTPHNHSIVSA